MLVFGNAIALFRNANALIENAVAGVQARRGNPNWLDKSWGLQNERLVEFKVRLRVVPVIAPQTGHDHSDNSVYAK